MLYYLHFIFLSKQETLGQHFKILILYEHNHISIFTHARTHTNKKTRKKSYEHMSKNALYSNYKKEWLVYEFYNIIEVKSCVLL